MNIFGTKTFSWWQVGILKLSVLTFGIAIGAYWSEAFSPYFRELLVITFASGMYIAYLWFKKA